MRHLTARKRAEGLGSAKTGTTHLWHMQVSAAALAILIPIFIITFGSILGAPHGKVIAYFGQPFPAIITALTLVTGLLHFMAGARVMIEDYTQGTTRILLILLVNFISYAAMATGLFALVRLAI